MDKRATASIILLMIAVAVFLYDGAIGPFLHSAGMHIEEARALDHMSDYSISKVPGHYALGGILSLIIGVTGHELVYLPIQVFAFVSVSYVTFREFSGQASLAVILTGIYLFSQTRGSNILFYQHGIGTILFVLGLYLIARLLTNRPQQRAYTIALLFTVAPLISISYNNTLRFMLVLGSIALILRILKVLDVGTHISGVAARPILIVALFLGVVVVGLSRWFYGTFVPQALLGATEFSAADVFALSVGGSNPSLPIPADMVQTLPEHVLTLGLLKYALLGLAILYIVARVSRDLYTCWEVRPRTIIIASLGSSVVIYSVARLFFGQVSYSLLFFPSMLSLALAARFMRSQIWTRAVYGLAIAVFCVSGAILGVHVAADSMDRGQTHRVDQEHSAEWYLEYGNDQVVGDVRSRYIFASYFLDDQYSQGFQPDPSQVVRERTRVLRLTETVPYLLGNESAAEPEGYFVIDKSLHRVALQGWVGLKPWPENIDRVEGANTTNKIYSKGDIQIHHSNKTST